MPSWPKRPDGVDGVVKPTFQPVLNYAHVRLSDVVSDQIRAMIFDGRLLPGQRLPAERELAEQLQVSRPSLREALIRLDADGFIQGLARGGFVVSNVTAPLVSDPLTTLLQQQPDASAAILELRHALESISTAYAAERADAADMARIGAAFDALEAAAGAPQSTNIAECDAAFHLAIAGATHNVAISHVMHGLHQLLRDSMQTSHRLVAYDAAVEADLHAQHRAIYEAITARDPARAQRAAGAHLDYVRALYRDWTPPRSGA
jgi:GntR family transcriptional repressor for pyruvate dehydrogenase complex